MRYRDLESTALRPARCQLRLDRPIRRRRWRRRLAHERSLSPFTSAYRYAYLLPPVVYIPVDLRSGERARRPEFHFVWRYIRYPRGVVRARPAAFPANLKNVRHLDGSHAPSLDAVKVDLKGCTAVAGSRTRQKCNHIVSTPTRRWSFVAPLVTVATPGEIFSRPGSWEMP